MSSTAVLSLKAYDGETIQVVYDDYGHQYARRVSKDKSNATKWVSSDAEISRLLHSSVKSKDYSTPNERVTEIESDVKSSTDLLNEVSKKTDHLYDQLKGSLTGLKVNGVVTSSDQLPSDSSDGDVYVVNDLIYIRSAGKWIEAGSYRGPQGNQGIPGPGLDIRGSVTSVGDLPSSGQNGYAYFVGSTVYAWIDTKWISVGDIAPDLSNYPTTDLMNKSIDEKIAKYDSTSFHESDTANYQKRKITTDNGQPLTVINSGDDLNSKIKSLSSTTGFGTIFISGSSVGNSLSTDLSGTFISDGNSVIISAVTPTLDSVRIKGTPTGDPSWESSHNRLDDKVTDNKNGSIKLNGRFMTPADDSKVVHTTDMRKPASDVAGIDEVDAFEQAIQKSIVTTFDTVAEMKNNAKNLLEGMTVKTLGYYQANDAGAATYYVTAKPDANKHYEELGNTLFAELIDDHYNLAMRGAKTDGSEDISQIFNEAVKGALANDGDKTIRLPAGTFLLTNSVNLPIRHLALTGENGTTFLTDTGTDPAIVLYGPTHWAGVRRSIKNINFREKNDKKAGTKAILIGDENYIADTTPPQAAAQFEFVKCGFTNYDTGIVVGNDAYLFDFISCSCSHLNRFISTSSQNIINSGEKIGIANCILTACSDTVFYLENFIELHVTNSSIDALEGGRVLYVNDPEFAPGAHQISFTDCHFEPGNITKPIFEIDEEHNHCALDIENSTFWLNEVSAESLISCGDLVNTINFNNNFIGTSEDQMTFISNNSNANITNTSLNTADKPVAFSQNIINNNRNKFKNASLDGVTDLISNVAYGVGNVYSIQRDNSDFSNSPRITTTNAKMSIDSDVPQGMLGKSIKIDASGQGIFNFDFMAPVTGKGILEFAFNIKSNINLGNALSCYHLSSDGNVSSSFEFSFYRTVQCDNAWEQFYSISAPYKLRGGQSFAGFRLVLDKSQLGDAVTISIYNPYVNVI